MNHAECDRLEFISGFDPSSRRDWLSLVKEIVALANRSGGKIMIGISDTGDEIGIDETLATKLDAADITNHVDEYIKPDHVTLSVEVTGVRGRPSRKIVTIEVEAADSPPLVFTKPGQYHDGTKSRSVFEKHGVVRRRGTKAELATRNNYRDWIDSAVKKERQQWQERVALIAKLGPEAQIQVIDRPGAGPSDEPSILLQSSVRAYKVNPNRLLGADDLLRLFVVRRSLKIGSTEAELLIQSSLRKRATLFFWLDLAELGQDELKVQLQKAVAASDRDKSDAGRAVLEVAALTQTGHSYRALREALAASTYKHFREAASLAATKREMLNRINDGRNRLAFEKYPIRVMGSRELELLADEIASEMLQRKPSSARARQLSGIGLEIFCRHTKRGR